MQFEDKRSIGGEKPVEKEPEETVETVDLRGASLERFIRLALSVCAKDDKENFEAMIRAWLESLPPPALNEFYLKTRVKMQRELTEIARGLYTMFKANQQRIAQKEVKNG